MTRVKICGITSRKDAFAAAEAGADVLGFIAVPGSPRYVDTQQHFEMTEDLPVFIQRVIVVRQPDDSEEYGSDYIQHYEDDPTYRGNHPPRIRVFRMRNEDSLREIAAYSDPVSAILLDTDHKDLLGGSGETFDWSLAARAKALTDRPIILAGGLTPENVQDALEAVRPYAVDVSSGVEASQGVKDIAKVRAFVRAVREWDLRQR